ncbi:hypothetical protein [Campylobacter californiensis]|uniref:hypothetical protein n=1 Tax=Campylobacter californiensis TaxID=1032243 RepID=UPI001473AE75|nr:hypothetical protein [Campylobacter sp. RM12916]MBE3610256.1 hypothetical protein [Campylobacter sp. RM12916]
MLTVYIKNILKLYGLSLQIRSELSKGLACGIKVVHEIPQTTYKENTMTNNHVCVFKIENSMRIEIIKRYENWIKRAIYKVYLRCL